MSCLPRLEFEKFKDLDTYIEFTRLKCSGIYIIWNKTKDIYYVGQSKNIKSRIFGQHFGSHINKLFFIDKKLGDKFYFNYFKADLDKLDEYERLAIRKYNSYKNGYNKTDGDLLTKKQTK